MPIHEHLVRCGGLQRSANGSMPLDLLLHGPKQNVFLKIEDIDWRLGVNIPGELIDLMEIAAYVYAADSAVSRGGKSDARLGARWRRRFRLAIPVRRPELWASQAVIHTLVQTLSFLSEGDFSFDFELMESALPAAPFLDLGSPSDFVPSDVILFSGGLDSLAGAVETLRPLHRQASCL